MKTILIAIYMYEHTSYMWLQMRNNAHEQDKCGHCVRAVEQMGVVTCKNHLLPIRSYDCEQLRAIQKLAIHNHYQANPSSD